MDTVSLTIEPGDIHEEEGLPPSIEDYAANIQKDGFDGPDDEYGKDGKLCGPGKGDWEGDGMEWPSGYPVVQYCQEGHRQSTDGENCKTIPVNPKGTTHLPHGSIVSEGTRTGEGVDVEVEGAVTISQMYRMDDVAQGATRITRKIARTRRLL